MILIEKEIIPDVVQAIKYTLNQWHKILVCFGDEALELDTNLVENMIRPTKLGMKNWMFFGSLEAGKYNALIYTLLANCRAQGLDPEDYLVEVLKRLPHNATPGKPPDCRPPESPLSAKPRPKRWPARKPSKSPDRPAPPNASPEQRQGEEFRTLTLILSEILRSPISSSPIDFRIMRCFSWTATMTQQGFWEIQDGWRIGVIPRDFHEDTITDPVF